eukprot:gnl/Spiro4/16237_TR8720_c0_g1_i2.p2 gnl/Spiro4/16237_TR8720_c0_g1~~gnl/Spiro4/16237_TR8720_c0_g1_i2.p2  ORF type:complete len:144 (+),score=25.36 gnl/Spiro4/16237_TR8720_c0_g1_i2:367-798(+)
MQKQCSLTSDNLTACYNSKCLNALNFNTRVYCRYLAANQSGFGHIINACQQDSDCVNMPNFACAPQCLCCPNCLLTDPYGSVNNTQCALLTTSGSSQQLFTNDTTVPCFRNYYEAAAARFGPSCGLLSMIAALFVSFVLLASA